MWELIYNHLNKEDFLYNFVITTNANQYESFCESHTAYFIFK